MVGAATAIKLAQQGSDVTIIEKHLIDADSILSSDKVDIRISAINRFSEHLLDELGAMPLLRKNRIAPYQQLEAYQQQDDHLLFDCKDIGETHLGHLIENSLIQASLWQQFADYNIEVIEQKTPVTDINQTDDSITLHYGDTHYMADLVIAADGGQSQLRTKAGLGVTGWQYAQHCMGVLIKLDAPQQVKTWQQFTPTGPVAFLPMQAPYANLICYHDAAVLKQWQRLSNEELKAKLIAHFPELPGDFELLEHAVFPLARQHANDYSQGRLVLAMGEAHTINPLAGQGVNLGFQDWLQSVEDQEDVGQHQLLKQYGQKRRHAKAGS